VELFEIDNDQPNAADESSTGKNGARSSFLARTRNTDARDADDTTARPDRIDQMPTGITFDVSPTIENEIA